jgi:hypothetical protein
VPKEKVRQQTSKGALFGTVSGVPQALYEGGTNVTIHIGRIQFLILHLKFALYNALLQYPSHGKLKASTLQRIQSSLRTSVGLIITALRYQT